MSGYPLSAAGTVVPILAFVFTLVFGRLFRLLFLVSFKFLDDVAPARTGACFRREQ